MIFEERSATVGANMSLARRMYKRFVGDRLPSSVGGLHEELLVCIDGCPKDPALIAIWITCAECEMEEDWCNRRYESQPELAVIASGEVNLRNAPTLAGRVASKLYLN